MSLRSQTLVGCHRTVHVSAGVMQLVESGRVDLDAPISRYLDDLPVAWRGIRVRQLLGHTSGLPDIVDEHGLVGGGTEQEAWDAVGKRPIHRGTRLE